jgi:hypothetical protein
MRASLLLLFVLPVLLALLALFANLAAERSVGAGRRRPELANCTEWLKGGRGCSENC